MAHRKGRKPQNLRQNSSDSGVKKRPPDRGRKPKSSGLWLYGVHAVLGALENPARTIERLVVSPEAARRLAKDLDKPTSDRQIKAESLTPRAIGLEIPAGAVHQGIAVLTKPLSNPDLGKTCAPLDDARSIVLVLDQITDPRNFGAILRSAKAFGALAVVATDRHAPTESGALAKAASGALETVPVVRVTNLARSLETLADLGYWRTGLSGEASHPLDPRPDRSAVALVLGAEGAGLRRLTTEHCDSLERIPVAGASRAGAASTMTSAGSLNVSVAAAVALYEMTRTTQN
jgi:23S rRNA (guanosine2251-2'-O)-methyltransferase